MPAIVVEKPKMSRPMWNSLKCHVTRERQRKKLEQEADAEVERQRREREDQQKEQEMTLEETKEQVAQSESRLAQLKEDKHQLFLQLKKVLHEDDTRRKIKESNFNDMILLHGYPSGGSLSQPSSHASIYMPSNHGTLRQTYSSGKEESILNLQGGLPPPSIYSQQSISLGPSAAMGNQTQASQKRSRSPSPPQLYHSYKSPSLSPYSSKNTGNLYNSNSALPGSIFYTHSVSVNAAQNATNAGGYQTGQVYNYPATPTPSSRPAYSTTTTLSKDEGSQPTPKHHTTHYGGQGSLPVSQHSHIQRGNTKFSLTKQPQPFVPFFINVKSLLDQACHYLGHKILFIGYHQSSMDVLLGKSSASYGATEQDKFFMSTSQACSTTPGSVSGSCTTPNGGLRSHVGGLLSTIPGPAVSHSSGIPIQQSSHGKSGSIITGNPLRPPLAAVTYQASIPTSHAPSPRLLYTQSGGQPQHPNSRYFQT